MNQQSGIEPIYILKEGTSRTRGHEARAMNVAAAKAVSNAVRSTLGPNGMDKMLVDGLGDVIITNDGATILKEMDIEHPAAKMIVEVAKTQDEETGDGTTTAVVIAGELLKQADELLSQEIHPTTICEGYYAAAKYAKEVLSEIAFPVKPENKKILTSIAETALTSRISETAKNAFCDMIVQAVSLVAEKDGKINPDHIKMVQKVGGSIQDSMVVHGMVIDKERVHSDMPKEVKYAKILLLNVALELKKPELNATIQINSLGEEQAFIDEEIRMIRKMAEVIIASGANVVFCQKGIDDIAQGYLAKAGILAVRRVKKSDMDNLARATGGKVLNTIKTINRMDLGSADLVIEKKIAGEEMIQISGCKNPKAVSIIIHGGTTHVVDELERSLHDTLMVVADTISNKKAVSGGGSIEIELSLRLMKYAARQGGRTQLAIEAFARALEIIPKTLAENSGYDTIDVLVGLKKSHEEGRVSYGLDVFTGTPADMKKYGVVEPLKVKIQSIMSATEAAVMILRIDDVVASSKTGEGGGPEGMGGMPPGMPPGMGGY
ncbi:MAG: thermosome subunit [Methanomicrobiales archaeon]|nr:thermosome subunit [Methanomicrobiales archaeon]